MGRVTTNHKGGAIHEATAGSRTIDTVSHLLGSCPRDLCLLSGLTLLAQHRLQEGLSRNEDHLAQEGGSGRSSLYLADVHRHGTRPAAEDTQDTVGGAPVE